MSNNIHTLNSFNNLQNNTNLNVDLNSNRNPNANIENIGFFKSVFPYFKLKSLSFFIIVIHLIMYVLELIFNDKYYNNWNCTLFKMGAKYTPAIKLDFQIQRLISPLILHANLMHLFFNNLSIIFFGFYIEHLLGVFKYTVLYISSGFFSLLLSSVVDSTNLSVGASGSIMGLSAFFLLFYILNYRDLPDINKKYFYYFLAITIMNLFQTTTNKGDKIDISSHIGGFVSGVLISLLSIDLMQIKYEDQIIFIKKLKIISAVVLILILAILTILLLYINIDSNLKYIC